MRELGEEASHQTLRAHHFLPRTEGAGRPGRAGRQAVCPEGAGCPPRLALLSHRSACSPVTAHPNKLTLDLIKTGSDSPTKGTTGIRTVQTIFSEKRGFASELPTQDCGARAPPPRLLSRFDHTQALLIYLFSYGSKTSFHARNGLLAIILSDFSTSGSKTDDSRLCQKLVYGGKRKSMLKTLYPSLKT